MNSDPQSLLNQLAGPGQRQTVPGQQGTGRIRALLTGDDGQTPPSFSWRQRTYDTSGNFVDMVNGLSGSATQSPARDRNNNRPPSYPWEVELVPAIVTQDLGTVWVCDVSCCSETTIPPLVPCDFVTPGKNGWPLVVYLTLTNIQSTTGSPYCGGSLSFDQSGVIFPLVPNGAPHYPFLGSPHWSLAIPVDVAGGPCFLATVNCSTLRQLRLGISLLQYVFSSQFGVCPGEILLCEQSAIIPPMGLARQPINYSGSGSFSVTQGPNCFDTLCSGQTFDWQLSEFMP